MSPRKKNSEETAVKKRNDVDFRVNMFKNLKDKLRCSECGKLPRPKELMRMSGSKLFCAKCYEEERGADEDEDEEAAAQSLTNKLLRDELPFQCKNTDFGCNAILMPDDLFKHEVQDCQHFQVHCAVLTCQDVVGNLDYIKHLETKHHDLKTAEKDKGTENTFKIHTNCSDLVLRDEDNEQQNDEEMNDDPDDDDRYELPHYINEIDRATRQDHDDEEDENEERLILQTTRFTVFDRHFFDVCVVENGLVYRWIYGLINPGEDFQFRYLSKNEEKGLEVVFTAKVHSLNEDADSIIESQENVFITGVKAFQSLANDDNMVTFAIAMRNLKEERVKDSQPTNDPQSGMESGSSGSERSDSTSNNKEHPAFLKLYS